MRIKFLTSIAGPHFSHKPGDVVVWPDANEAVRLCEAGHAIPIPDARDAEEVARQLEEGTGEDDDADAEGDSKESKPDAKGKPDAKSDSKESKPDAKGKGKGK